MNESCDFSPEFENYCEKKRMEAHEAWNKSEKERLLEKHANLDNLLEKIRADDKKSVLEAILIASDSLAVFDALPDKSRADISNVLREVARVYEQSKDFSKKKRGELSEEEKHRRHQVALTNALRVEYNRNFHALSVLRARGKVEDDFELNDHTVSDHHKKHHREAKKFFEWIYIATDIVADVCGSTSRLPRKHNNKK